MSGTSSAAEHVAAAAAGRERGDPRPEQPSSVSAQAPGPRRGWSWRWRRSGVPAVHARPITRPPRGGPGSRLRRVHRPGSPCSSYIGNRPRPGGRGRRAAVRRCAGAGRRHLIARRNPQPAIWLAGVLSLTGAMLISGALADAQQPLGLGILAGAAAAVTFAGYLVAAGWQGAGEPTLSPRSSSASVSPRWSRCPPLGVANPSCSPTRRWRGASSAVEHSARSCRSGLVVSAHSRWICGAGG